MIIKAILQILKAVRKPYFSRRAFIKKGMSRPPPPVPACEIISEMDFAVGMEVVPKEYQMQDPFFERTTHQ